MLPTYATINLLSLLIALTFIPGESCDCDNSDDSLPFTKLGFLLENLKSRQAPSPLAATSASSWDGIFLTGARPLRMWTLLSFASELQSRLPQRSCPTSSGALSSETPAPLLANGNSPSYLPLRSYRLLASYRPPSLVRLGKTIAVTFFLGSRWLSARLSTGWAGFLFLPAVILPALL